MRRALFAVWALLAACPPLNPEPPLRVGTTPWAGYEPFFLARDRGFLTPDRARLVEFSSTTQVMRAFRNGSLELAGLPLEDASLARERGLDLHLVLVVGVSTGADALLAQPGLGRIEDLRGKRVGVENSARAALLLERVLATAGLSDADVTIVTRESHDHLQAFRRKEVEGLVTFEPYATLLRREGASQLFDSRSLPGQIVNVLAVRADTLQQRRRDVAEVVRAWFQALDEEATNPGAANAIVAQRTGLSAAEFRTVRQTIQTPKRDENLRLLGGAEPELAATLHRLSDVLDRNHVAAPPLDVTQLFDPSFVVAPR